MIAFEGATTPLLYKITGSQPSPPPRAEITAPPGARPITPDQAFNVARAALPGAAAFLINVPEPHEPYFVRMRYPEDLTPGGRSRVAATLWSIPTRAKRSGRRVRAPRPPAPNRAIHTGDIFGIPSKAVASLASLMAARADAERSADVVAGKASTHAERKRAGAHPAAYARVLTNRLRETRLMAGRNGFRDRPRPVRRVVGRFESRAIQFVNTRRLSAGNPSCPCRKRRLTSGWLRYRS